MFGRQNMFWLMYGWYQSLHHVFTWIMINVVRVQSWCDSPGVPGGLWPIWRLEKVTGPEGSGAVAPEKQFRWFYRAILCLLDNKLTFVCGHSVWTLSITLKMLFFYLHLQPPGSFSHLHPGDFLLESPACCTPVIYLVYWRWQHCFLYMWSVQILSHGKKHGRSAQHLDGPSRFSEKMWTWAHRSGASGPE